VLFGEQFRECGLAGGRAQRSRGTKGWPVDRASRRCIPRLQVASVLADGVLMASAFALL